MTCIGGSGKRVIKDSPAGAFIKYHKFASYPGSPPINRFKPYIIGSRISEYFNALTKEESVTF